VLVRDTYLEKVGGCVDEYENWRLLRRLSMDPYLERVVLRAGPLDELGMETCEGEDYDQKDFQDVTWLLDDYRDTGKTRCLHRRFLS